MKKGFSIVEVLVAVSISAVVGAAMWTLIDRALNSSNYFLDRQEYDEAIRQVQFLLMRSEQCAQALGANDDDPSINKIHDKVTVPQPTPADTGAFTPVSVFAIFSRGQDSAGVEGSTKLLQANQPFGRINIGPLTLRETIPGTGRGNEVLYDGSASRAYETYLVSLTIPATSREGRPFDTRHIPFKIYVRPATRTIDMCILSNLDSQTCSSFGGTYNEALRVCEMPECGAGNPPADSTTVFVPCKDPVGGPSADCGTEVYYWGFTSDGTTTRPACICSRSCVPPPNPPAPAPTPNY